MCATRQGGGTGASREYDSGTAFEAVHQAPINLMEDSASLSLGRWVVFGAAEERKQW